MFLDFRQQVDEGKDAHKAEQNGDTNPYEKGTPEADAWRFGWDYQGWLEERS